MEKLVALCANRGFIFPSSEIYGGIAGFWDYGPLGTEMRNNVKAAWWQRMVRERDDVVGLDSSIIANPQTWVASGHVANFNDPMVDCRSLQAALPRDQIDPDDRCTVCARRQARPDRAAPVQPDAEDAHRRGGRLGRRRVSARGDLSVDLPRLQARDAVRAHEAAVRDRADRQGVPQRDHAAQLHLPLARVRADGARVLHAARRGDGLVRALPRDPHALAPRDRHRAREAALARARPRRARALREGRLRRGVRVPVRLAGARGRAPPRRLRPAPAQRALRQGPVVHRSRDRRSATSRT